MISTVLEVFGFALLIAGAWLLAGLAAALLAAGIVLMVVGYMVGDSE
jgi:hypothetical protein